MGGRFQVVVDVDATAEEADALADKLLAWLVERGEIGPGTKVVRNDTNLDGVEVWTERTVFYSLTGDLDISCPYCAVPVPFKNHVDDLIGEWYDGGSGVARCPHCERGVGLNDWRWTDPWAFGYLGFRFWGWDWFSDEFLDEVAHVLHGHRIVRPYGKL